MKPEPNVFYHPSKELFSFQKKNVIDRKSIRFVKVHAPRSDHPHLERMDVGVGGGGTEIHPLATHYEAISLWRSQASLPLTGQNCMFAMYILVIYTLFLSFMKLSLSCSSNSPPVDTTAWIIFCKILYSVQTLRHYEAITL